MDKKIYTSNYCNVKHGNLISISKDKGKDAGYEGNFCLKLAPKEEFFRIWKNNRGKISEEENNLYYIKQFYNQVLKPLDPEKIIQSFPNNSILLCYEGNDTFCHRHLVAFWLELFLDIKTYELLEIKDYKYKIQKRPEYLKEVLEKVIKEDYNMHGYNSIRAAYLFERAELLEKSINERYKEENLGNYETYLYTTVETHRRNADAVEQKYLKIKKNS